MESLDTNLYSRQIHAIGVDAMAKLAALRVFIYSLRGVGIETAKNLILAGPKQVIVQDDTIVELKDLGSNFYCTEEDVGKRTRAAACIEKLKALNHYVQVGVHEGDIDYSFLAQFDVVVFTDYYDEAKLFDFNNFCRTREKPIGFILGGCLGLYGFCFVDFGPSFTVWDKKGNDPKIVDVAIITNDNPAVVSTFEGTKHGLFDGDRIRFKGVQGMTELNGQEFEITVEGPETFMINADTTNFGTYKGSGVAEQVKVHHKLTFKGLEQSTEAPLLAPDYSPLEILDYSKFGMPECLHIAFRSMLEFVRETGGLPRLNNEEDAEMFLKIFQRVNDNVGEKEGTVKAEEFDKELVRNIARFARAQTSCHAAFFGGIVAQEVVKFTGKFMPLRQWLHFENYELLPKEKVNREPMGTRYDDQVAILGREIQERLMNMRYYLIVFLVILLGFLLLVLGRWDVSTSSKLLYQDYAVDLSVN